MVHPLLRRTLDKQDAHLHASYTGWTMPTQLSTGATGGHRVKPGVGIGNVPGYRSKVSRGEGNPALIFPSSQIREFPLRSMTDTIITTGQGWMSRMNDCHWQRPPIHRGGRKR